MDTVWVIWEEKREIALTAAGPWAGAGFRTISQSQDSHKPMYPHCAGFDFLPFQPILITIYVDTSSLSYYSFETSSIHNVFGRANKSTDSQVVLVVLLLHLLTVKLKRDIQCPLSSNHTVACAPSEIYVCIFNHNGSSQALLWNNQFWALLPVHVPPPFPLLFVNRCSPLPSCLYKSTVCLFNMTTWLCVNTHAKHTGVISIRIF